jgi:hypothetical protein
MLSRCDRQKSAESSEKLSWVPTVIQLKLNPPKCRIKGSEDVDAARENRLRLSILGAIHKLDRHGLITMPKRAAEKKSKMPQKEHGLIYLSPQDLATRWRCSRSTVNRITEREGLTRLCLGEGRNGIIRYLRSEIEELEESRLLSS